MINRIIIPLAAIILTACSGSSQQGRELSAPPDSLRHNSVVISDDSLSYYLGLNEGESRAEFLVGAPDWLIDSITDKDYIAGVRTAVSTDTSSNSFGQGAIAARELAFYVNTLQHQGVKINRRLFAERMKHYIMNRIIPENDEREKSDSISNKIITRCLNSYDSQL